jgi:ribosomal protein L35
MSKMKSRGSITKRLKITKNGKVMRRQSFRRHLKAGKTSKRLGNLKRIKELTGYYAKKIRKVTGTGSRAKSRNNTNI